MTLSLASCSIRAVALFMSVCAGSIAQTAYNSTPCDPEATPEARNLLAWLASLPAQSGNKVVSGQLHVDHCTTIQRETGQMPGLLGEMLPAERKWDDWSRAIAAREAWLEYWNAGGIPEWSMKIGNPISQRSSRDRTSDGTTRLTLADFATVAQPGTPANARYNEQLDKAAIHLAWLRDRHVPIILRPLHEMNGSGWWYGDWQQGGNPTAYKALWRYTFDYLTKTKGLHNLLWAYAPTCFNGTSAGSGDWEYTGYYPGDAYVDIAGFDFYPSSWRSTGPITAQDCRAYGYLKPIGKVLALLECGPGQGGRHRDYRKLTAAIHRYMPDVTYWLSWSYINSMRSADNDFARQTLEDPWVCNRDEIPNLKVAPAKGTVAR